MNTTQAGPLERAIARRALRWLHEDSHTPATSLPQPAQTTAGMRDAVVDAMQQHLCDHYTRRPGVAALCQAVMEGLSRHGIIVDSDEEIVISGGADEARFVAVRSLAAGQNVFLPTASIEQYRIALEFAGATETTIELGSNLPETGGGILILPTLDPATGRPLGAEELAHVADWVRANDLTVIADEIHTRLLDDLDGAQPFATQEGMFGRTLTLGGFAHAPALHAWRVAWFAGPAPLVGKVRALKQAMTICSPAPGQYAALASLQKGDQ